LIAQSLRYITDDELSPVLQLLEDVARLLNALQASIKVRVDQAEED